MNDPYLNDEECIKRLVEEWRKHEKAIIAFDYDHTVFDFHKKGYTYEKVIDLLRRCREVGAHLIVFTCSAESRYDEIREYLTSNNIPFDKINENVDNIPYVGRKLYYNILLDDRAGLCSAFNILEKACDIIEKETQHINCTTDVYEYIKFLFDYKTKYPDLIFPDIKLLSQFKLFMTAPVAIYKGQPLEAAVRKVKSEDFAESLNQFSALYCISKIKISYDNKINIF